MVLGLFIVDRRPPNRQAACWRFNSDELMGDPCGNGQRLTCVDLNPGTAGDNLYRTGEDHVHLVARLMQMRLSIGVVVV